jgi:hypothetical protein
MRGGGIPWPTPGRILSLPSAVVHVWTASLVVAGPAWFTASARWRLDDVDESEAGSDP